MPNAARFAPAAILAVGCLMISGVREQKRMPARIHMRNLAINVPGLATRDTTIDAEERRVAGMDDYVLRYFDRGPGDNAFTVYVGYYTHQVQGKAIHSPKNCLPGAGWEALNASVQPVSVGGASYLVNRYLLANKGQQALVYYWYQGRGRVEANEYRVKYNLLHDAALYGRTEEALVRIVVPLNPDSLRTAGAAPTYAAADTVATHAAQALIPTVTNAMPAAPGAT